MIVGVERPREFLSVRRPVRLQGAGVPGPASAAGGRNVRGEAALLVLIIRHN